MSTACPDCGAVLPSARPGSTVACPACRNPVLVPTPVERVAPPAPPREERTDAPPSGSSWTLVGAALLVLAIAHVGLWLLLTTTARAGVARAEDRYASEEMESALAEEDVPASGDLRSDLRRKELRETASAWETDRQHVSMVGYALLGAYLLQAGILVMLRLRTGGGRRPRTAPGRR